MITRLEVDGFKSLRDFAVDLEPCTVLVGPNSAGKSNVMDALALLSRLASGSIEEAFKLGRGRSIDQFTRRGGEAGGLIRFAVEVLLPDHDGDAALGATPNRYRYELCIERRARRSGAEALVVREERLHAMARGHDVFLQVRETARERRVVLSTPLEDKDYRAPRTHTTLAAFSRGLGGYRLPLKLDEDVLLQAEQRVAELGLRNISELINHVLREDIARSGIDVSALPPGESETTVSRVANALTSFRLLQLDAGRLREPSDRIGIDGLATDASNLPTVLADLPGPVLGEIRADLVALVPGISSFEVVPEGDSFRLDFELSGGERLSARLISDGTLRILALLTALRVEPRPSVLAIEEPENGVYPGRLRTLFEFLREATVRKAPAPSADEQVGEVDADPAFDAPHETAPPQILVTSHSPVVLATFRSAPHHLRFVDLVRRDGQLVTRARSVVRSAGPDRGYRTISLQQIDALLHADDGEAAE